MNTKKVGGIGLFFAFLFGFHREGYIFRLQYMSHSFILIGIWTTTFLFSIPQLH